MIDFLSGVSRDVLPFLVILYDYVLPFLVILTILVFVHEMGHYLIARRNGVRVEVFSIGFGPELFGWYDAKGTRWKVSAVPLGGYVKMFGDADESSGAGEGLDEMTPEEKAVSFHHKTVAQRAAVVIAGPAANFIFAIVLLAGLYAIVGQPYTPAAVDEVQADSAAAKAGLLPGDMILSVDGSNISRFEELQRIIQMNPGANLPMQIERDGKTLGVVVIPGEKILTDRFGNERVIGLLGVRNRQVRNIKHDLLTAVWEATVETYSLTVQTLEVVGQMIAGSRDADDLGGPLRIAEMSGDVAKRGLDTTVWFMALLSINLGLINLFPIPVLDGGHLVFYFFEALRGRPLGERIQEYASIAGLTMVIGLMIFVTWNDLTRWRVFDYIGSIFS